MNKCPNCGNSGNIDRNLFCHNCGVHLRFDKNTGNYAVDYTACGECGQLNASNVNFCSKCGVSLKNEIISYGPETNRNSPFGLKNLHSRFVAVGIALLLGVSLTWFLYSGGVISNGPRIDVVFCIDTTGSMGDEIDVIKTELNNMINNIKNGNPRPSVRFGIVAFRDRGDNYVVKEYKLTEDVRKFCLPYRSENNL